MAQQYAGRRRLYDFEEQDPASLPPAGYLWTNAAAAGISIRNFGYMVDNKPDAAIGSEQITGVRDPVLAKVTNRLYRGFDLAYPDVERAKIFLGELAEYEKSGNMPRLIVMRLGNDHTTAPPPGGSRRFPWRRTTTTPWACWWRASPNRASGRRP